MPRDIANGMQRGPAQFAGSLGDIVRHAKYLRAMFVQKQVVVAEMPPAHMPVEIFGLHVEREAVGKQRPERCGNLFDTVCSRSDKGVLTKVVLTVSPLDASLRLRWGGEENAPAFQVISYIALDAGTRWRDDN